MRTFGISLSALAIGLTVSTAGAEIFHRTTIEDFRAVSLAYDAAVCGVWVANEGAELVLLNTGGKEIRRGGVPAHHPRRGGDR